MLTQPHYDTYPCPACQRTMRRMARPWLLRLFYRGSRLYYCSACQQRYLLYKGTLSLHRPGAAPASSRLPSR